MSSEKKRKNPWHTRKVNLKIKEINDSINSDEQIVSIENNISKLNQEYHETNNKIISFNKECEKVHIEITDMNKRSPDSLPIESLKDLYNENRSNYKNIKSKVDKLKKEEDRLFDKIDQVSSEKNIKTIELLQAKINKILEITNN